VADRVAVVTGGTQGIGRAIAERFARAGDHVLVVARDARRADAVAAELGRAEAVAGDVADPATAQRAVDAALERWGTIDVLVNNAAIDLAAPLLDVTAEQARHVTHVNLLGTVFFLQVAARAMREHGGGAIVNISSRLASVGVPEMAVYGATKGGVEALTRGAAIELAPHGIRVNAVAPGFTETPLFTAWAAEQSDPAAARTAVAAQIPQGRIATTADVAAAVWFLASEDAAHITGAVLAVDGGYTAQ
jgi:NAD(P)-dependent dehydrogenase (short-subunit alcohol dehydrogenase family)